MHNLRVKQGLLLRDVQARSGLGIGYLSEVERGIKNPTIKTLERYAAALDLELVLELRKKR